MTTKEKINRNIGLTFDFLRYLVDNPQELKKIKDGTVIEFVEKDFPKVEKQIGTRDRTPKKYVRVNSQLEII